MSKVTLFCFAASYALALGLELWYHLRPRPVLRLSAVLIGGAGLLAQTVYLVVQRPTIAARFGWMLVLAWILGIFYVYGTIHHRRQAWGIFVLPLVLGLVIVAAVLNSGVDPKSNSVGWFSLQNLRFLSVAHVTVLLMASVGVCVGFLASLMYLVQAQRLKTKALPEKTSWKLPSLERLESMNRHAIILSFPLLTLGMFFGGLLMFRIADRIHDWTDPRVLSSAILWLVLCIVLYLRYGQHAPGRRVAWLTIVSFLLLMITMVMGHMDRGGM